MPPLVEASSPYLEAWRPVVEEASLELRPTEHASAPPGGRVLPPSARRRPSKVRSTSDLRDAVAGAVARAAAQGPLSPHGLDEEEDSDSDTGLEHSELTPETAEADDSAVETAPGPDSPVVPTTEAQPTFGPSATSADLRPEPYEEFARLADQQALGIVPPTLPDGYTSSWPPVAVATPAETAEVLSDEPTEKPDGGGTVPETQLEPDALDADTVAQAQVPRDSLFETTLIDDLVAEALVSLDSPPANLVVEEAATEASAAPDSLEAESAHDTEDVVIEETPFPFGERRSAARQARKPLPAALQEAVAAGAAQDLNESGSQPAPGQSPYSPEGKPGKGDAATATAGGKDPGNTKPPGVVRRYGSAIAIVVLFLAAGGVAAGIAAFRGPVNPPGLSTVAQDQAAANGAVLTSAEFPAAWRWSGAKSTANSFGLGSPLVTPAIVQSWLAGNKACSADLNAVTAAMTPTVGDVTAVAYSRAGTTNPLGGPWQIADAIAFHTSTGQVSSDLARMQAVLAKQRAQRCVARFWSATLQSQLPTGSLVMVTVSPRSVPQLAGKPAGWAMEMQGTETVGQTSIPLRCQISSFAAGRAQVYFVVSSRGAALPAVTAAKALNALGTRAERLRSPTA
ncbi:MAG: hypothetical protein ABSD85_09895 [Acidimicrobiales bacterium]